MRGGDKGRSNERTYALGHTLINTNNGVLCNAASRLDGPNVLVMWSAMSSDMYNIVVKRASVKKVERLICTRTDTNKIKVRLMAI